MPGMRYGEVSRTAKAKLICISDFQSRYIRFWSKVNIKSDDECWEWTGTKNAGGYGTISMNKKRYLCHRVSFVLTHNMDLLPEFIICHHCDNPKCVNPKHLFMGSHADNAQDRAKKKRQGTDRGGVTRSGKLPYTELLFEEIREKYKGGFKQKEIESIYGISQGYIARIIHNEVVGR